MEQGLGGNTAGPRSAEEVRSAIGSTFAEEHRALREMDAYAGIFADRAFGVREADRLFRAQIAEIRSRRAALLERLKQAEGDEIRDARERLGVAAMGGEEMRPGTPMREPPAVSD